MVRHRALCGVVTGLLSSCAAVAPPTLWEGERSSDGLACSPLRGTSEGLLLQVAVTEALPTQAQLTVSRDGEVLGDIALADLAPLPRTFVVGDANLEPDHRYEYRCEVTLGTERVAATRVEALAADVPPAPRPPTLEGRPGSVRISWRAAPPDWVRVWRRDVLDGGPALPISPTLSTTDWADRTVESGRVYAYALQATRYVEALAWRSDIGSESYIEVTGASEDSDRTTPQN